MTSGELIQSCQLLVVSARRTEEQPRGSLRNIHRDLTIDECVLPFYTLSLGNERLTLGWFRFVSLGLIKMN